MHRRQLVQGPDLDVDVGAGLAEHLLEPGDGVVRLAGEVGHLGQHQRGGPGQTGVSQLGGHLDRLGGRPSRRLGVVVPALRLGVDHQRPRPQLGGRILRDERQRLGRQVERVEVDLGGDSGLGPGQQQPGARLHGRGVGQHRQVGGDELDRPVCVAGVDERVGGARHEPDLHGRPGAEHLERGLVVLGGLLGRPDPHRLVTGLGARGDGGLDVVRGARVEGQLRRGAGDAAVLQGGDVGGVQARALAGEEVVVDRLGSRAWRNAYPGWLPAWRGSRMRASTPGAGRGRGPVRRPRGREHAGEQLVGDPPAGDRRGADHAPGRLVEPVQPDQEQVGEVDRERGGARRPLHPAQLLDEEGVAVGPGDDRPDLLVGERIGMQGVDQRADGRLGQRTDLEPVEGRQPRPLREGRTQRVTAVDVVAAVGHDERDGSLELPGEEVAEQLAGGLVGPVDVLDHDQQGLLAAGLLEQGVDAREEVGAA